MTGRLSIWKQLILCLALALVAGLGWWQRAPILESLEFAGISWASERRDGKSATGGRPAGRPERQVPVIVARAESARDDLSVEVVGTGKARRSIMLRTEAAGLVTAVPLASGATFKKGDTLLALEARKEKLAVALAETRLADAERSLKRFQRLQAGGNLAAARLDEAETAARLARLELDRAREQLADRRIVAPFAGVAGLTDVEVGAWIDSDVAVAPFDDRSAILVEFDLPEVLIARVRTGMAVAAMTPAAPGRVLDGEIVAIDSRVDAASRSIKVRVAIPNADDRLRPGASFAVQLDLPGGTHVRVPELALQFSRASLFVWRIRDGRAERAGVRLIRRLDGAALIEGDVAAGDVVVVEGTQRLVPGRAVQVKQAPGA